MTHRPIKKTALAALLAGGAGLAFAATLHNGEDGTDSRVLVVQQHVTDVDQPLNDLMGNSRPDHAHPIGHQPVYRAGLVMGAWQVSQTTGGYNAGGGEGGTWIPLAVTYAGGPCVTGWGVDYGPLGNVYTGNGQEVADRRLDRACPPGSGNIPP